MSISRMHGTQFLTLPNVIQEYTGRHTKVHINVTDLKKGH